MKAVAAGVLWAMVTFANAVTAAVTGGEMCFGFQRTGLRHELTGFFALMQALSGVAWCRTTSLVAAGTHPEGPPTGRGRCDRPHPSTGRGTSSPSKGEASLQG